MKTPLFHPLKKGDFLLPEGFPDPFQEVPHPIAEAAATALMERLEADPLFADPSFEGKMFGVLVVRHPVTNELGYLSAFSGNVTLPDGRLTNHLSDFVPPVFDLLDPNGFFKQEEPQISALNRTLEARLNDPSFLQARADLARAEDAFQEERQRRKDALKAAKAERDRLRSEQQLTENEEQALIRNSQFEKAEFRRWEKAQQEHLRSLSDFVAAHKAGCDALRQERSACSQALEQRIFEAFVLTNGLQEQQSVWELSHLAPGGTGECAAPKLLQYAWTHGFQPIALAEFWWGQTSNNELRYHRHFYGACRGKCGLILPFQLRGLTLATPAANPFQPSPTVPHSLEIVWEDEDLLVVNKPAGVLSLPGKDGTRSLLELLNDTQPAPLFPVHRLDRDTSGLLVYAKHAAAQSDLQGQFQDQLVAKEYIAVLETWPASVTLHETQPAGSTDPQMAWSGSIDLPLAPDWIHRPRQQVDFQDGKPSLTHYTLLPAAGHPTGHPAAGHPTAVAHPRVRFVPVTGRTHQLRVHAAHPQGLGAPILGDPLYGSQQPPQIRMHLHACRIAFCHPKDGKPCCFFRPPEF